MKLRQNEQPVKPLVVEQLRSATAGEARVDAIVYALDPQGWNGALAHIPDTGLGLQNESEARWLATCFRSDAQSFFDWTQFQQRWRGLFIDQPQTLRDEARLWLLRQLLYIEVSPTNPMNRECKQLVWFLLCEVAGDE